MSPEYVAPYVKAQKTDDRDAEAIAEAATRPTMRLVTLKSEAQLDLQVLHRARERLVAGRTRLDQPAAGGAARTRRDPAEAPGSTEQAAGRADGRRAADQPTGAAAACRISATSGWSLDRRIKAYDDELVALTREDELARRLATIPGIGVINATALLAAVGDASAFAKGRDLAAWLGLTPRQHSTGGKTKLLGISKRGNKYLRTQLIHGARAAMVHFAKKATPWAHGYASCSHGPILTSWSLHSPPSWRASRGRVLRHGSEFDHRAATV